MSKRVLVFDFGASSARAMLCKYENGSLSLEEIHRFPNNPIIENDRIYWDFDELWEQMKIAISFGVFNGGFDAISIDTWGVDFGLIDKNGELIGNPVHYRDPRTSGIPEEVYKIIPKDRLFMQSGIQPMNINTIFQLYYLAQHESNTLFRAEKMLMMPDLFAYMLTGAARSELTEATTSQLVDLEAKGWNIKLIEQLSIPKRIFCPIIRPGEVYGTLKRELCEEFRIEPVPVIACCSHDTASAVMAVPAGEESFAFLSCGTWTLFGTELRHPVITENALKMELTNEGGYGGTTTLLKNIMGLWLIQETRRHYQKNGQDYSFMDLEKMALESEPFVSFINPNDPLFASPENMPIKIGEFCRRTNQPVPETAGEVMRCIYQSLACEFALTLEKISKLKGQNYEKVYMIGGGTKDKLLCRLTAEATGKTAVAGPIEATALGNGISSLITLGEIESLAAARQIIIDSGLTVTYQPTEHDKWISALEKYRTIVE